VYCGSKAVSFKIEKPSYHAFLRAKQVNKDKIIILIIRALFKADK